MPADNVMFKIIGTDQKEYGPVSAEQVRQWIAGGRANAQTQAQAEGATDWKPLGEFPEFAAALATRATPGAPPPASAGPAPTSGMAIASLVLGLLGICGITAIVGLVLGIVSLGKIKRSEGRLGGQGFAIAGIALSAFMLLIAAPAFLAGLTLPAMARAKQKSQTIICISNIKQLCLATMLYADDHDGHLPTANVWCDLVQPYVGKNPQVFLCPAGEKAACHYAFNAKLGGVETKAAGEPMRTVLVFEADGGWNVSGGPEQMLKQSRHHRGIVVGFADGHVELVLPNRLDTLVWEPQRGVAGTPPH